MKVLLWLGLAGLFLVAGPLLEDARTMIPFALYALLMSKLEALSAQIARLDHQKMETGR